MIFEFRIWGLIVLFFLITLFSFQKKKIRGSYYFILLVSYLSEFFYIICYILEQIQLDSVLFTRIYYLILFLLFSFYMFYFVQVLLEEKYRTKKSLYEKKIFYARELVVGIDIIGGIIILFLQYGLVWKFILISHVVFSFLQLVLIMIDRKELEKKQYHVLLGFIFLSLLLFVFQIQFSRVEMIQSLVVILAIYLYLTIESPDKKQIQELTVERDYGLKNILDKQSFLRKLSHEIRIPINSIDGFSQIMVDANTMGEMKEEAKDIRLASRELIDLINGMIDLSILESGELKLINEGYNVYDVFHDLEEIIQARLKSKNVHFSLEMDEDIPEVLLGDADRIEQILLNIISNSIKYTDKGSIQLQVSSVKTSSLCRLIINVRDTGRGMSKEEINHLFSYQDDEKGIGFKVAYYLLDLMNGKVDIDSIVGKGTTVTITLDQDVVSLKDTGKEKKNREIQIVSFKEKRVLLVDDNKLNLKVASKLLLPYEVEVVSVMSGQECLDLLDRDNHFDLILMDDMMPNMSGVETLDILRKIERVSGFYIPVVALTANAVSGMKEKYLDSGFDDYLSKPIQREELDRVLKKFLK